MKIVNPKKQALNRTNAKNTVNFTRPTAKNTGNFTQKFFSEYTALKKAK